MHYRDLLLPSVEGEAFYVDAEHVRYNMKMI